MSRTALARRGRPAVAAIVAAALLVSAAGCSSSSDDADKKDEATTTTTAAGTTASTSTTAAPIDPDSVEGGADAYAEAMAPLLAQTTGVAQAGGGSAECLAPLWVDAVGIDTFARAGIRPEDLGAEGGGLGDLALTEEQATAMAEAFTTCDVDLVALAVEQISADADGAASVKTCLRENLTQELLEASLVAQLTNGEAGDSQSAQEAAQPCMAAGAPGGG